MGIGSGKGSVIFKLNRVIQLFPIGTDGMTARFGKVSNDFIWVYWRNVCCIPLQFLTFLDLNAIENGPNILC